MPLLASRIRNQKNRSGLKIELFTGDNLRHLPKSSAVAAFAGRTVRELF